VLVFGDVMDDVIVRPCGSATADSDTPSVIERHPGGSAANQAAWLGSLGSSVAFVGRVGSQDWVRHTAELERCGVRPQLVADELEQTGQIVVLVDGDRRDMYVDRGANRRLTPGDFPGGQVETATLVHCTGYSLFDESCRGAALDVFDRARSAGVPISVVAGSAAFLHDVGPKRFLDWTDGAFLLVANADEARVLTDRADPLLAASRLAHRYRHAVVTAGAAGAVFAEPGREPVLLPATPVAAADPTGAGDAFCAALLHSLLGSEPLPAGVAAAMRLARHVVGRLGARP
jgi:sugar/nucleoside kinase (ribokinase family)